MKAGKSARQQANALLPVASRSPEQWGKKTTGSKPLMLSPNDRPASKNAKRKASRYGRVWDDACVTVGQAGGTGRARTFARANYAERLTTVFPTGFPSGIGVEQAKRAREYIRYLQWLCDHSIF